MRHKNDGTSPLRWHPANDASCVFTPRTPPLLQAALQLNAELAAEQLLKLIPEDQVTQSIIALRRVAGSVDDAMIPSDSSNSRRLIIQDPLWKLWRQRSRSGVRSWKQVDWVLIGEGSHGTHEYYQLRADITKLLIERRGFNAVATEAGELSSLMCAIVLCTIHDPAVRSSTQLCTIEAVSHSRPCGGSLICMRCPPAVMAFGSTSVHEHLQHVPCQ